MMQATTFTIAAVAFLCGAAAATSPPVTFESPCECRDNHGEHRWAVKNDPSTPPVDASAIQAVTPSDVFIWPGPAEHLTQSSERTGSERAATVTLHRSLLQRLFLQVAILARARRTRSAALHCTLRRID